MTPMFNDDSKKENFKSRSDSTRLKIQRLQKSARNEEPDRVPMGEFFWGSFIRRWREELGLAHDANPYYHYDLDWIAINPNMDPHIRQFETIVENDEEVQIKTGYEVIM